MQPPFGYAEFDLVVLPSRPPSRPSAGAGRLRARAGRAARRQDLHRRSARLGRSAREPRDGSLRAAARRDPPAAAARGGHPRLPRRERARPARRPRSRARASISSSGSSWPASTRRSAPASAARRRRSRTRSRSAGTSPASRASSRYSSRCWPARRVTSREKSRGTTRLRDRGEPVREPRHGDLGLAPLDGLDDASRATSSGSMTKRRMNGLRSLARCGKPSVSTKPGMIVCTWMPRGREQRGDRSGRTRAARASTRRTRPPARRRRCRRPRRGSRRARPACRPGAKARRHQTLPR